MGRTLVGFGFGPIQSGLFICEAVRSGRFDRYVVAEVDASLVAAVRRNHGHCHINIAHKDHVESMAIGPVELLNPADPQDRAQLVQAIAEAPEIVTALPKVSLFDAGGESSVAALLAKGIERSSAGQGKVVYTAENHNHAAEILQDGVASKLGRSLPAHVQFLNTVIGKMSGVVTGQENIQKLGLTPLLPESDRAILVEEFNKILITQITLPIFDRGLSVFIEKPDLLPFEEAKLYGHNAIHAMIGYLADIKGYPSMADAAKDKSLMDLARQAFVKESGAALVKKYAHLRDPLFTANGFQAYVDDLLERMGNPYLNDLVARVIRDPARKLSYNDRLIGAMKLALQNGVPPKCLAQGAAAAVLKIWRDEGSSPNSDNLRRQVHDTLHRLWADSGDRFADDVVSLITQAMSELRR